MSAYRDRVRIEYRTDAASAESPTWATLARGSAVPCSIEAAAGGESMRGRQVEAHITAIVEMRKRTDLTPAMRLVVLTGPNKNKIFNLASVVILDRRGTGNPPRTVCHCIE